MLGPHLFQFLLKSAIWLQICTWLWVVDFGVRENLLETVKTSVREVEKGKRSIKAVAVSLDSAMLWEIHLQQSKILMQAFIRVLFDEYREIS